MQGRMAVDFTAQRQGKTIKMQSHKCLNWAWRHSFSLERALLFCVCVRAHTSSHTQIAERQLG